MLERYFKSEKEFEQMLDQQFSNGEVFEKSFNEFLQANFADQNNRENELKKKGE